ncbi:LysR family transcriptional regulator [Chitinasiproducens palmae]|uniref:DNA-binding transcriptional regulator, LysR family n=1 Tax=Chitinasiproducens palmae TaxID=1770053 RepID=A0A1H2PLH7_9BURK|nr:LysR family transcriptional regulator [Chitinasiproducens palmae]SDV46879.1 DNA-binding transcriptional regulator, LysR family [Chitinasiproducens palmae]
MRDFDWDDVQAFLAISRAGRLTVAAQQMGVDHSTLSRRIAALEKALGVRLFERRPSGFLLTAEGERALGDAEAMESMALRLRHRMDDASSGLTGSVRIGTPEGFGTYFLGPRIAAVSAAHPQLEIELIANPRMFSLSKREADLAVSMTRPSQGRVYAHKLTDYALGVYASRRYIEAHPPLRSRDDLLHHPWVGYVEDQMWSAELNYLPQISNALSPIVRISNVISQMSAVAGGAGLGVLPCFMARTEPQLVRLLADEITLTRAYWLVTLAETRDVARVKLLADFIRAECAETVFWDE